MARIGVIARADHGGLASLTYEVVRNLRPDRVLLIDLGLAARGGSTDRYRFDGLAKHIMVTRHRRSGDPEIGIVMEQFVNGLDILYTAETPYTDHLYVFARAAHCKVVLHVMPELFVATDRQADVLWAPTEWERQRLPERTEIVPVPVALDQFTYRQRTEVSTLFATTGEAMLDRNGWDIVREAMKHVEHPLRLLWRGPLEHDPTPEQVGHVTMQWLPPVDDYTKVIPDEADLLVMPRRYGGLCLPSQEAAAQGVPTMMTNLPPQRGWVPKDLRLDAYPRKLVPMRGGEFVVYEADPVALARMIDALVEAPARVKEVSEHARAWAESISWDVWLPEWRRRLEAACV